MRTIPSLSDLPRLPTYTAVGGTERAASTGLSAILLNRGGRYPRRTLFQELEKIGFDYIISMEGPGERYDLEEMSGRFPSIRFILLKEQITLGEQINLAVAELSSPLFFVLWNDLRVLHNAQAGRIADRILKSPSNGGLLCVTPVIQNSRFEVLPTLISPGSYRNRVHTMPLSPLKEGMSSLYPFDAIGVYNRLLFAQVGGYDPTMTNFHWQLMDLGFRSHLWGMSIRSTQTIRLSYNGEIPREDSTPDESYRWFYLKNIAPLFRGDEAILPWRRFPGYLFQSGQDPFMAYRSFNEGRKWVRSNARKFKADARTLTDLWNYGEAK